ncbi:MAG TPA: hypothetical protein VLT36_04150 [Candidatus Dormibacteraeota bacterium]|nr:hypothetical protein [Candidatus Dormibacteraeota bacterium]
MRYTHTRRALLLIVLLAALAAPASPLFESNSVPLHRIPKFVPTNIPTNGLDWKMQEYLRYSDKVPLNFADKYTLLEAGCGTGCIEFCLIDRTTGVVHQGLDFTTDLPRDYTGPWGFKYSRKSRELVVYHGNNFQYPVFVDCYAWDGMRFTLLHTDKIQENGKANKTVQRTGPSPSAQETNRTAAATGSVRGPLR